MDELEEARVARLYLIFIAMVLTFKENDAETICATFPKTAPTQMSEGIRAALPALQGSSGS